MKKIALRYAPAFTGLVLLISLMTLAATRQQLKPEVLLGFWFNEDKQELGIRVYTTGCTAKSDFRFQVTGSNLRVERIRRDACKMMPRAADFTFTLAEAGLQTGKKYVLKNKITVTALGAQLP